MILLNITFSVDDNIAKEFIGSINNYLVPAAEKEGLKDIILSKIRTENQENFITHQLSSSYAMQLQAESEDEIKKFKAEALRMFYNDIAKKWGPSVGCFETILDIIS